MAAIRMEEKNRSSLTDRFERAAFFYAQKSSGGKILIRKGISYE